MGVVSMKLAGIQRFRVAADLYEGFQMYKEAIDVYIQGQMFDEARSLANRRAPQYLDYISGAVGMGNVGEMPGMGGGSANLDLLAQQNDWDACMRGAQKEGSDCLAKYSAQYAKHLVTRGDYQGAVEVFQKYMVPSNPAVFDLYKRIAHEILAMDPAREAALKSLKEVLYKLVSSLQGNPAHQQFQRLLYIVHFVTMKMECERSGLGDIAAKIAVALVRYCTEIPADKAFHDAGQLCKKQNWFNMAFVFFNRYLDLTEAMEDPDGNMIDNSDFANTDVPFDFPLPEHQQTEAEKEHTEEVRDWVLHISMDNDTEQSLDMRDCEKCGTSIYTATLNCHNGGHENKPCIITGYPVLRDQVQCKSCHMSANRVDWNNYVSRCKSCPWCGAVATPY
jgi:intraflagellar transport protein 172